jgi:hypothetical protein
MAGARRGAGAVRPALAGQSGSKIERVGEAAPILGHAEQGSSGRDLADLILLEPAAGGSLDVRDAAVLLTLSDRGSLVRGIEKRLPEVRPDISQLWRNLLADGCRSAFRDGGDARHPVRRDSTASDQDATTRRHFSVSRLRTRAPASRLH